MMNDTALFTNVLLLEDDESHAFLVKRVVAPLAAQVRAVKNCSEAEAALDGEAADLIVTDLNVPDGGGAQLISRLVARAPGVPILVLTSSTSVEDGVAAMKLGARDFIVKNFDDNFSDVLRLAISRVYTAESLNREREALRRDLDTLRLAIENSNDGFAVIDTAGAIRYNNSGYAAFAAACGGDARSILSLAPDKLVDGIQVLERLRQQVSSIQKGAVWHTEVVLSGQRDFAFDVSLSGVSDHGGIVAWVRDVRERKRRERLQKELLSTTTHDLKGPLGAIALSCDVILSDDVSQNKVKDVVQRIASSANNAITLIEELLSARRIEEGTLILKPASQDVTSLVDSIVHTWKVSAAARKLSLEFVHEEKACTGTVDRLGFERVVANLISNAIKFTKPGGSVSVHLSERSGNIEVRVADTGEGMEPHEVKQLFERFSRLAKHAGTAGSGLGLFIVKSIVNAHGGRVEVTSSKGEGTTFTVLFPATPPVDAQGQAVCLGA